MLKLNKKIIFIALVAFLIIMGVLIYFFMTKPKTETIRTNYQQFSQQKLLFPSLAEDGSKILYFNNESDPGFYEMNLDGTNVNKLYSLDTPDDIFWSPIKDQVILKVIYDQYIFEKYSSPFAFPGTTDQTETTWYFNLTSRELKKLSDNIASIIWLSETEILYQTIDADNNSSAIYRANKNGESATKLVDLPDSNFYGLSLAPDRQRLVLYSVPQDVSGSSLYELDLSSKNLAKVTDLSEPVKALALAKDKILITLNPASEKPELVILDHKSEKKLGIYSTTDKTLLIDPNTLLVIVSDSQNEASIFYKVDLNSTKRVQISLQPQKEIDVSYVLVSGDQKTIYFFTETGGYKLNI